MNICFETFGCRLNRAEALEDEARSLAKGHFIVDSHEKADLIVVRGCSVTARAQHDCEQLVNHLREKYPAKRVFITGCLPGAKKLEISALSRARTGAGGEEAIPMRTSRAYLKVQDGCSCGCTFCIVPKFRGAPVSVPFSDVLRKAGLFIEAGYREIVVTGCNLMLYSSEGRRLPDLIAALAALSPECRVRLGSVEPGPVAMELVHAMHETPNVCRFLHLSVQSGSDRILTLMRRPYLTRDVDAVAAEVSKLMPLAGLGCDLIAGFPDETETDFRLTKGLLARHPFSNVHAFPYSERPGTLAAAMISERILPEIRRKRARELAELGTTSRQRAARRFLGRTVDIVVEKRHPIAGWTGEYLWLEANGRPGLAPKLPSGKSSLRRKLMKFMVKSVHGDTLYGEPARNGG